MPWLAGPLQSYVNGDHGCDRRRYMWRCLPNGIPVSVDLLLTPMAPVDRSGGSNQFGMVRKSELASAHAPGTGKRTSELLPNLSVGLTSFDLIRYTYIMGM